MMDKERALSRLHEALGHRRLNRTCAKVEILLGLLSVGSGLLASYWGLDHDWFVAVAGLFLFVFGGYLALAGHRSHLYQSNNELAAYVAEEIRLMRDVPRSNDEPPKPFPA